ncbi:MAG: hypothetical protein M1839_004555 [Geoglossum umbratile]|nr:MAG: hypothetical protein M1839_004555 [Geoglossum umbratile]
MSVSQESLDQIKTLADALALAFPHLQKDFECRFAKWKDTWPRGGGFWQWVRAGPKSSLYKLFSSSTVARGQERDSLVAMGSKIIPHIVNKLRDEENVFAVEIYTELRPAVEMNLHPTTSEPPAPADQARRILIHYSALIANFNDRVNAWEAHKLNFLTSSNSDHFIRHETFDALVEMGDIAVPLIMEMYSRTRVGWWCELLFRIVEGRPSGMGVFVWRELWEKWSKWFEESHD